MSTYVRALLNNRGVIALAVAIAVSAMFAAVPARVAVADVQLSPHLEVDADPTNGAGPCNPVDATRVVPTGINYTVAICVDDNAGAVRSFEARLIYAGGFAFAPEIQDLTPGLDDNPDFNQAPGPNGNGPAWDCTALGFFFPHGDDPQTTPETDAHIVCNATNFLGGPLTANPGLLATVTMTPTATGVESFAFAADGTASIQDDITGFSACGTEVTCPGALITQVPGAPVHDVALDGLTGPPSVAPLSTNSYLATARNAGTVAENVQVAMAASVPGFDPSLVGMAIGALPPGTTVVLPPTVVITTGGSTHGFVVSVPLAPGASANVEALVSFPPGAAAGGVGAEACHAGDPADASGRGFPTVPATCTGSTDGDLDANPANDPTRTAVSLVAAQPPPATNPPNTGPIPLEADGLFCESPPIPCVAPFAGNSGGVPIAADWEWKSATPLSFASGAGTATPLTLGDHAADSFVYTQTQEEDPPSGALALYLMYDFPGRTTPFTPAQCMTVAFDVAGGRFLGPMSVHICGDGSVLVTGVDNGTPFTDRPAGDIGLEGAAGFGMSPNPTGDAFFDAALNTPHLMAELEIPLTQNLGGGPNPGGVYDPSPAFWSASFNPTLSRNIVRIDAETGENTTAPAGVPADIDADGVLNAPDNCPAVPNGILQANVPGVGFQKNTDGVLDNGPGVASNDTTVPNAASNAIGDACDFSGDLDRDGLPDTEDTEPLGATGVCSAWAGQSDGHPSPASGDTTNDDNGNGNPAAPTGTDPADNGPSWDTDNDGVLDGVECQLGTNPRDGNPMHPNAKPTPAQCGGAMTDADGDGLPAAAERCKWGTSDTNADSDGDGKKDCVEANDTDGNGNQNFTGDVINSAKAALGIIGKTMDYDLDGNGNVSFTADTILSAKMALNVVDAGHPLGYCPP